MSEAGTSAARPAVKFKSGNERLIKVLPDAAGKLTSLLRKQGREAGGALRVAVVGGGCSGLQYKMDIDVEKAGDKVFQEGDGKVIVDRKSFLYLLSLIHI